MAIIILQNGNGESNVHYEFDPSQKPLGEGGMGRVFYGLQVEEGSNGFRREREVAIKCLLEDLPDHAIKRSRREASIRLKNDNLVEMIDFVETVDNYTTHYHVVSELLNGVNLDELLEGRATNHDGKPNPTAERLLRNYKENRKAFVGEVFRNILSGIMALHDAGYIHRDIDPSNIMVTSEGKVKLIDFGIAKKVNELFTTGKSLTSPGQFIGKPYYAAPELLLGDLKQQSYTTDIYALGIMLFQLETGHLPFEGPFQEVYEKQMNEKLPLNEVEDKTVRKIIEKATEKDQKKRYQTSAEFRVDLDRWISEVPRSTKPAQPAKPSNHNSNPKPIGKWVGIAAACLAVIGLVVYFVTRPKETPVIVYNEPTYTVEPQSEPVEVSVETEEEEEIVEAAPAIPTVEEAEMKLKDGSQAAEGLAMLQQLVDNGDYQATLLMSRLYFDASAIDKGNDFYKKEWKTMRENCGIEADNVTAHNLLMEAFSIKENDPVLLYELGCDFMWKERGNVRDFECAKYCIDQVKALTNPGSLYNDAALEIEKKYNRSGNPPKVGKKPITKAAHQKIAKPEEEKPLF